MKRPRTVGAVVLFLVSCSLVSSLNGQSTRRYDPVTMDPPERDVDPAQLAEVSIGPAEGRINALLYLAAGKGPHPAVILLNGIPGNERNLDVAQALRRAGASVLYLTYRGTWGNSGLFSRANALADVSTALRYLRSDDAVGKFKIDSRRLALVGHSFGAWVALMGAAADPAVACVGALDVANIGVRARRLNDPARFAAAIANSDALIAPGAPYRAESGMALVSEMKAHADEWDLIRHASMFQSRSVLLISATNADEQAEFVAALRHAGAARVIEQNWETDHSFSDQRIRLARAVVEWLKSSCGF
jgi:uncharacterized protein